MSDSVEDDKIKFEKYYEEVLLYAKINGVNNLLNLFCVLNQSIPSDPKNELSLHQKLLKQLYASCKLFSIDFLVLFFQTSKTCKSNVIGLDDKKLHKFIFDVVANQFDISVEEVFNDTNRDGIRIYASGSIFKIFIDTFGLSSKQVKNITKKPTNTICRHRTLINKLEFNHPTDRKTLNKFVRAKKIIIKYFLDGKR